MRTTLDLPESLLLEAMKITHTNTKTGVIVQALEELIRAVGAISEVGRNKQRALRHWWGAVVYLLEWAAEMRVYFEAFGIKFGAMPVGYCALRPCMRRD